MMRTFKLTNGYSVTVQDTPTGTDFWTRDSAGETVSTVHLKGDAAAEMLTNLRVAAGLAGANG